jgi:hypothetical protein
MNKNYFTKKLLLSTSAIFGFQVAIAQCVIPPTPTVTANGSCGNFPFTTTLTATGATTVQTGWYANPFGGNAVGTGSTYVTPSLAGPTVYYTAQLAATATASLSMPAQTSIFNGSSRGYYFTAPTSFVITGVRVPTDASSGNSNIAIIKFIGNVAPPLFPTLTNSLNILYLTQNNTSGTGTIAVNIPVYAGEVIGVLGDRAGANSYASAPSTQSLGSSTVTLTRMGMQFPLATTSPTDIFSEAAGSLSRVELYTSLGCLNSLTAYTVTSNPSPTVTAVSSNTAICAGSSATLTANGANTYSWSTTATTSNTSVSPTVTTLYTVVGTGTNGCTGTATVNLNVNPTPTVAIAGPTAVCVGSSATLTANGANTYSWSTTATTSSTSVSPTVTTLYSVVGTGTNGCTRTATVNLNVNPTPVIAIAGPTAICVGSSATLTASGANTYSWSTTATTASITVSPTANVTYTSTGTSSLGCIGISTKSVIVNVLPSVSLNASPSTICQLGNSTFTISTLNGVPSGGVYSGINVTGNTFTSSLASGSFVPVYSYTNPSTGCSNTGTTSITIAICLGLNDVNLANEQITVSPNPSKGIFTITFANDVQKTMEVIDITGRVVFSKVSTELETQMNIENLANGVYYLRVNTTNSKQILKLVKQ